VLKTSRRGKRQKEGVMKNETKILPEASMLASSDWSEYVNFI
jgi:hypothetical protein